MDFFDVIFVVDQHQRIDMWLLVVYLNGANSYTKLQLITFAFL